MEEEIEKNITKTGTVNVGIVCKEGIVLASDRRVSLGSSGGVAYLGGRMKKIIPVNDRFILSMAGVASDATKNISFLKAEIKLKELKTKVNLSAKEVANLTANMLFQNIRTPSMIPSIAHFLFAGIDNTGTHLFDISPDGYLKEVENYASSGSGMMQADAILDSDYKKDMPLNQGIDLAVKCIKASAGRDPGVGEGIDIYVIKKDKIEQVLDKKFSYELKDNK
jgi:proteasome beta subunit